MKGLTNLPSNKESISTQISTTEMEFITKLVVELRNPLPSWVA